MQREISIKVQLGENLNPLKDIVKVPAIDNTSDLKDVFKKVDKLGNLWEVGKIDYILIRYLPGLTTVSRQGQIYSIIPKKTYASTNCVDKKALEFTLLLAANTYRNYSSLMIVLPIWIKKATDKTADTDATVTMVNNFLEHWLKEVDIKQYPDEIRILPTNNTVIYRYSKKMLKHLPYKALITIEDTLLYSREKVVITNGNDRRSSTSTTEANRTDLNLNYRLNSFNSLISKKLYYRIPLKYFVDLGLVNFPEKTDTKFIFILKSNMNKLFESKAKVTPMPRFPNVQILHHDTPYISYQQLSLDDNYKTYFNITLLSKMALRTGVQFSAYQQSFEVNIGTESVNVNFQVANRQFAWIEISLVYDRSDQHQTVYDNYNAELAATKIRSLKLENASTTYSLTGRLLYDVGNEDDKHWLYSMFAVF